MKIVREHLNEIRQSIEGSGLGAIGIGKEEVLKAWRSAKSEIPFIIHGCKQMSEAFKDPMYDDLIKILERRGKFKCSNMLWVDEKKEAYNFTIERQISEWLSQWGFSRTVFKLGGGRWETPVLTDCKFDDDAKVGSLIIGKHDIFGNVRGFFIQNK